MAARGIRPVDLGCHQPHLSSPLSPGHVQLQHLVRDARPPQTRHRRLPRHPRIRRSDRLPRQLGSFLPRLPARARRHPHARPTRRRLPHQHRLLRPQGHERLLHRRRRNRVRQKTPHRTRTRDGRPPQNRRHRRAPQTRAIPQTLRPTQLRSTGALTMPFLSARDYQIAIPSYKRPELLSTLALHLLRTRNINLERVTVFLHEHDPSLDAYRTITTGTGARLHIHNGHGVLAQRHEIAHHYPAGTPVVSIYD